MLARSLELAIALDLHEHAARAYTNLSALAVEQRRNADALRHLEEGIAYCTDRDLDSWTRYMTAWRCVLFAELGRFDEALRDAERLLAVPGLPPVTAIGAGATIARIRSRRGEDAAEWLTAATNLAAETGELQRFGLAAGAAAESAWLRGDEAAIGPLTDAAWALAVAHDDPWIAGELAWWRSLAGIRDTETVELARPFALMLAGDPWAVRAWDEIGSPVWSAYAAGLGRDVAAADTAIRSLDAMGAPTAILAILRTRRARGLELPRRPRGAAKSSPRNLTRRELEILELLAEGLTNSEIAARLVISPRTAEHHITSVLRKLGEPTRARAVATAHRENIIGENR
jgi:DNA-binding CsgD family transcriptional regulator